MTRNRLEKLGQLRSRGAQPSDAGENADGNERNDSGKPTARRGDGAGGNLLSDGQRDYTWDAENRLVGITYPAQPGKATTFAYDGLSRCTSITSTPAGGGSAVTTSYIWCGARICQARDAGNNVTREYYTEGELAPGTPAQTYFYGPDQIGSVRRVFESTSSAPAYSYDPYGNALQATAPATDFGYAGMFYNADSGLYLTQYRAYDPVAGRWPSRDPLGESNDPEANLYAYADGNPKSFVDPSGRQSIPGAIIGAIIGGAAGYHAGGWKGAIAGGIAGGAVGAVAAPAAEAVGGAVGGLFGPCAGYAAGTAVVSGLGALGGGLATAATNVANGCNLTNHLGYGMAVGAAAPLLSGEAPFAAAGGALKLGLPNAWDYGFSIFSGVLGVGGDLAGDERAM